MSKKEKVTLFRTVIVVIFLLAVVIIFSYDPTKEGYGEIHVSTINNSEPKIYDTTGMSEEEINKLLKGE